LLDILAVDLRYALRIFRRSPGSTATAVVSLAVGIAAATGLFSIVNAALLNPFPFADINRIVRLDMIDKGKPRGLGVTARQLVALQHSDVLDGAFVSNTWEMTLTGQDLPEAVRTQYFSANALNVLGVPPLLGRVFNEADGPAGEQPQRVVVLTYRFWQRHFGGRPEAVGQTLYLNREPYTVIGVLSRTSLGYDPHNVIIASINLPENSYECDPADESRPTCDDPFDSGSGAYRRSQSTRKRGTHSGRRAGKRGLGP
jgi:hypothetical protein